MLAGCHGLRPLLRAAAGHGLGLFLLKPAGGRGLPAPRDAGHPGSPTHSLRPSAFPPHLSLLPPPPVLPQRESQQSRGRRDISYLDFPYFLFFIRWKLPRWTPLEIRGKRMIHT